jgi:hypothetical protein
MKNNLIICVIALILSSCNKKPVIIEAIAPCDDCVPLEADFQMGYRLEFFGCGDYQDVIGDSLFVNDTVTQGWVTFKANVDCYDSLIWQIGSDPSLKYSADFSLLFGSVAVPQTIPVSLIAHKKFPENCLGMDEWDTIVKQLTIEDFDINRQNMEGDFLGHHLDEPLLDTFRVSIFQDSASGSFGIANISRNCVLPSSFISFPDYNFKYRKIFFCTDGWVGGSGCGSQRGNVEFSADYNIITVDYDFATDYTKPMTGSNISHKTFVGIRK